MNDHDEERRYLVGLAYRMLGSVADAEDVVQEARIRWHQHPNPSEVSSPRAWLTQVTVRLCIDRSKSARARRERYVGPWLPEPVLDTSEFQPRPDTLSELASDLSVALLLALERLSPLERAAFILHDVFDADWDDVAATLERTPEACRQLASRARTRVRDERPRYAASPEERDRVLAAFAVAASTGDLSTLTRLLSEDAIFLSDGGGVAKAALNPVVGRDRVARLVLGLYGKIGKDFETFSITPARVNGLGGFLFRADGAAQTMAFDVDDGGTIRAIYYVLNPEKLRHLQGGA